MCITIQNKKMFFLILMVFADKTLIKNGTGGHWN